MTTYKTFTSDQVKKHLLEGLSFIDVRAPVEFDSGSIPGSVNLPILNNEERAVIGTCYKQHGQEKAIELGHQIVSGENKENKLKKWIDFFEQNPKSIVTCFRGGKRSQITQQFLLELNIHIPRIENGYKPIRQLFIEELKNYSQTKKMILLTGLTGSAKTHLLKKVKSVYPVVDLEDLAKHRGSVFGAMSESQPSQADFENRLITEILKIENTQDMRPILYEDESRLIGHRHLTEEFFTSLRSSKVILVKQTLEDRIENIFKDYIVDVKLSEKLFSDYEYSLQKIEKRLGGAKTKEIMQDLITSKFDFLNRQQTASNRIWIEKLLVYYYDILYQSSFDKRNPVILFQGSHSEILDFLRSFPKSGSK